MQNPEEKTALITGASRGLGLALARALAERGWKLILNARGADALESVRGELAGSAEVTAIVGDVTNEFTRHQIARTAGRIGGLDVVVNNASVLGPSPQPLLLEYPIDTLRTVYETNVIAPLALLQALRPDLRYDCRVLNITSDAAREAYVGWGGYGSSKAALEHLSAILAEEVRAMRVYAVDPGDMRTQMHQEAVPGEDISDRPLPEASVPGILRLIDGDYASGRYVARDISPEENA